MKRKDPRAEIVDGSMAIELFVSARVDALTSMRDYFSEIYGNDQLGFDLKKVMNCLPEERIARLRRKTTSFWLRKRDSVDRASAVVALDPGEHAIERDGSV